MTIHRIAPETWFDIKKIYHERLDVSIPKIANRYGIPERTIYGYAKRQGWPKRNELKATAETVTYQTGAIERTGYITPHTVEPDPGMLPPAPKHETIRILYQQLEEVAPQAVQTIVRLLNSENERVRLDASKVLLSKLLPERSAHETWNLGNDGKSVEDHEKFREFIAWKLRQDIKAEWENSPEKRGAVEIATVRKGEGGAK